MWCASAGETGCDQEAARAFIDGGWERVDFQLHCPPSVDRSDICRIKPLGCYMSTPDLGLVARRVLNRSVFVASALAFPPCRDSSCSREDREVFRVSYWTTVFRLDQEIQLALGICPFTLPCLPAPVACLGDELAASLLWTASLEASLLHSAQEAGSNSDHAVNPSPRSSVPWVSSRINTNAQDFIAWEVDRSASVQANPVTPVSSVVSSPSSDSLANISTESPVSSDGAGLSEDDSQES